MLKIRNLMEIKGVLLQWFYKIFDKKPSGEAVENEYMSNQQLSEELHEPIIRKREKRKLY